jgi:YggT family protein
VHLFVDLLIALLELWIFAAIARAVLSWFPLRYGSPWQRVNSVLVAVTEPLIAPIRRILPPARIGGVGLDLAFLVVFVALQFFVIPLLRRLGG